MQALREKFFIRLFNSLFESEEQFNLQCKELGLDFSSDGWVVAFCKIMEPENQPSNEQWLKLCTSVVQMSQDTISSILPCYVTVLDFHHFAIVFCLESEHLTAQNTLLPDILTRVSKNLRNYFSINLKIAVGTPAAAPKQIGISYYAAKQRFHDLKNDQNIIFCEKDSNGRTDNDLSIIQSFRNEIRRAFEELNVTALYDTITKVAEELLSRPDLHIQAMDTATNILYMVNSLLPDGKKIIADIFSDSPDGYYSLYRLTSVNGIANWLIKLRDGCCSILQNQNQNYRQKTVAMVQSYIKKNLSIKLTLNEVAAVFNLSPNYLSQLFSKYADEGFVEYINKERILASKRMMAKEDGKIYEIAEALGYENAFYFSRVFKKVEGISPREYLHKLERDN